MSQGFDNKGPSEEEQQSTHSTETEQAVLSGRYFRPVEAAEDLFPDLEKDSPEYDKAREDLAQLQGFLRVAPEELGNFAAGFEHAVNITGYSGQGVHKSQRELLKQAIPDIFEAEGWRQGNTLVISGGTDDGIPGLAIEALCEDRDYTAAGIFAFPGVQYPLSKGYMLHCTDESWSEWGSETETMGEVASDTLVAGGGAQALEDVLLSVKSGESVAMIANVYNDMASLRFERDGERDAVTIKLKDRPPSRCRSCKCSSA